MMILTELLRIEFKIYPRYYRVLFKFEDVLFQGFHSLFYGFVAFQVL